MFYKETTVGKHGIEATLTMRFGLKRNIQGQCHYVTFRFAKAGGFSKAFEIDASLILQGLQNHCHVANGAFCVNLSHHNHEKL